MAKCFKWKKKIRIERFNHTEYLHEFHTLIKTGKIKSAVALMVASKITPKTYYEQYHGKIRAVGYAVKSGDLDVVETLLSIGFDVDDKCNINHGGLFPISIAVQEWDIGMVELLCCHGACLDPRCCTEDKHPLVLAIRENYDDIVRYLLIDINTQLNQTDGVVTIKPLRDNPGPTEVERWENTVEILISAGYNPVKEADVAKGQARRYVHLNPRACEPRRLVDLCCFKIRRTLGLRFCTILHNLPVPEPVKDKIVDKACNENFQDQLSTTKQVPRPAGRFRYASEKQRQTENVKARLDELRRSREQRSKTPDTRGSDQSADRHPLNTPDPQDLEKY